MSSVLWSRKDARIDGGVMEFLSGNDAALDEVLLPFDLVATRAHVRGLALRALLSADDADALVRELDALLLEAQDGRFTIPPGIEDSHSAIELALTDRLGELGKRVHLGRSRNDQVLVALRLFMIDALETLESLTRDAGRASLDLARRHEQLPMPGYTHLQRAVPSTVGLWMASFAESFADGASLLRMTRQWLDCCPLGTAAGYGVNLPLARTEVATDLGFDRLQINSMYAQASRGKHEHQVLAAAWQVAQDLRRLGWDLVLFSTAEFGFVTCATEMTTGSSIMPNKRNPDVVELLRTCAATVGGAIAEVQQVMSLPSGYHRDLQATKAPLIRAIRHVTAALELVPRLLGGLQFDERRMATAIDAPMHATDRAVELSVDGLPFRDAYRQTASELKELAGRTPEASITARVSPGACADLQLDEIERRLAIHAAPAH